ncbi:PREDICTED: LOW QUALITY PROTEIN: Niemann-Pick C1 protein-like, partial [Rhagoletis zephyria]|uniref:LOW QUALITY PROTEIN: Niemann-Pick C1 protein-like n=1 Tax=Rhagoletis zephyria TaxID=28612 RepID=UPI0008112EA7
MTKKTVIFVSLWLIIASTWVLNFTTAAEDEEPHCIWYGQSHAVGQHWLNKAVNSPPQPLNDTSAEAIFKRRCPLWYAEYKSSDPDEPLMLCCDAAQLRTMESGLSQIDGVFSRCPTCVYNMAYSICGLTCAQNHSLFLVPYNETYDDHEYIEEIDYRIDDASVELVYDSCAGIQHTQTGRPAMDLACGAYNAKTCDHRKWYIFMGDPTLSDYVPFPINYEFLNETSELPRLVVPAKNCSEAYDGAFACSCVDCSASCPYMDAPTGQAESYMIAGLYGITFIVSVVFGALVMVFILCGSLNICKPKIKISSCCAGFSCVNTKLSKSFRAWGYFCAKNPVLILAPIELWASEDSQTRLEKDYFDERFGPFYRTNQIFFKPINQSSFTHNTSTGILTFGPAFEKSFLKEVFTLQQQIEAITTETGVTLADVCYAPMLYTGVEATTDDCLVQSIFGYFQNNMDEFDLEYVDSDGYTNNYLNQLEDCLRVPMLESCYGPYGGPIEPGISVGGMPK